LIFHFFFVRVTIAVRPFKLIYSALEHLFDLHSLDLHLICLELDLFLRMRRIGVVGREETGLFFNFNFI
jgi:hypothetical protein